MIIFTWGRFNPPHLGHEKLITKMKDLGENVKVFLSHTNNIKNPLPYDIKYDLLREAFGSIIHKTKSTTINMALHELRTMDEDLIMVVGEDRIQEFNLMFYKYNKEFNFRTVSVVSGGNRSQTSTDLVETISSSKMRQLVATDQYEEFAKWLPSQLKYKSRYIYEEVKKYGSRSG